MRYRYSWARGSLESVPERAGLYEVRGLIPGDTMYHGQASNLRTRLLQHFREADIGFLPAEVVVTLEPNHLKRDRLERERIERDRPRYNRQLNPDYR